MHLREVYSVCINLNPYQLNIYVFIYNYVTKLYSTKLAALITSFGLFSSSQDNVVAWHWN